MSQESAAQGGVTAGSVSAEALRKLADEWMKMARYESRVAQRFAQGSEARAACDAVASAYAACYVQLSQAIERATPTEPNPNFLPNRTRPIVFSRETSS